MMLELAWLHGIYDALSWNNSFGGDFCGTSYEIEASKLKIKLYAE